MAGVSCYAPPMQRDFRKPSEKHPGQYDRFRIRVRWVRSRGAYTVYLTDAPAGEEPTTVQETPETFHALYEGLTAELEADGWTRT
ncbi:hypothetical protein CPT_Shady_054 [Streptomyces phage Shady]|uniref:Uncharacterized protein n=1 Tax=Streptomyces phage Shady TaxID=2767585 RepID=A0A873WP23_9CAUD|nr:hypothetical protein CPT_Shady_054 [Streptomyces phage Shady]